MRRSGGFRLVVTLSAALGLFLPGMTLATAGQIGGGNGALFFMSDRVGGHELFRADLDGSNPVNITNTPGSGEFLPAFSPNGEWLVFSSDRDDPDLDLYVMRPDGSDVRRVINRAGFQSEPAWCGDFIFFTDQQGMNQPEIGRIRPDGTGFRLITNDSIFDAMPTCNPDRQHVAWTREFEELPDIVQTRFDGSNLQNLTNTPDGIEFDPMFSPFHDLAFVSFPPGENILQIFLVDAGTGKRLQLTDFANPSERVRLPRFHPDGLALDATLQTVDNQGNIPSEHIIRIPMSPDGVATGPPQTVVDSGGHDAQAVVQPRPLCEVIDRGSGQFELRVTGTTGADDIFVRRSPGFEGIVEVVLNNRDVLCVVALEVVEGGEVVGRVTSVVIDGREGDDHLTVSLQVPLRPEVRGGDGNDILQVGTLDEIATDDESVEVLTPLGILGGDGGDELAIGGADPCPNCDVEGGGGPDTIAVGVGGATIDGGGGSDAIKVEGQGNEIVGGNGNDRIEQVEDIEPAIEDLFEPSSRSGAIRATGQTGTETGSTYDGGPGDDVIIGGRSDDVIVGGPGADAMKGLGGSDRFEARDGTRDLIDGGKGRDTAIIDSKDAVERVERVR